jgi:hypothetical protein
MNHIGMIQVTSRLLVDALHLPEGARIVALRYNPYVDSADITIEHPDMPAVEDGALPPTCWPRYRQMDTGVEFVSWGDDDAEETASGHQ